MPHPTRSTGHTPSRPDPRERGSAPSRDYAGIARRFGSITTPQAYRAGHDSVVLVVGSIRETLLRSAELQETTPGSARFKRLMAELQARSAKAAVETQRMLRWARSLRTAAVRAGVPVPAWLREMASGGG